MIQVTCPKCSKSYNLGDDKAGRTFRCQHCQGRVTVPYPGGTHDPFAPDWKTDIPEAIPYADSEIPDAIPVARARQSSRPSSNANGILIGVGAGVLLLAIAVAVILIVLKNRNPPVEGEQVVVNPAAAGDAATAPNTRLARAAYEYLPMDSPLMLRFRGQELWRDPVFKRMFGADHADNTFAATTIDHLGFHPDEFILISVAINPDANLTAAGSRWIAAIDLRDAIDWGRRNHPRFTPRDIGSQTLYELRGVFDRPFAAWQPQDKMLVFGDVALVEESLRRGALQEPRILLETIEDNPLIAAAADVSLLPWLQSVLDNCQTNPPARDLVRFITIVPEFEPDASDTQHWYCSLRLQTLAYISRDDFGPLVRHAVENQGFGDARIDLASVLQRPKVTLSHSPALHDVIGGYLFPQVEWLKTSIYRIAGVAPPAPLVAAPLPYGGDDAAVVLTPQSTAPSQGRNPPPRRSNAPIPVTPPMSVSPAVPVDAVRPPPLAIDLDRMQSTAEAGDFEAFVESFYPGAGGASGQLRGEADRLRGLPEGNGLAALATALLRATPDFSADGREATFRVSLDVEFGEAASMTGLSGYGSDLEAAVQAAINSLAGGDTREFVTNMFPASELSRMIENTRFQTDLETRLQVYPAMVDAMQAELQECLDVGLTQGEAIAEAILVKGRRTPRVVRFQLVDGHWRFFDPGPPPAADTEAEFETVTLVHDGQSWRLKELPECLER